MYGQIRLDVAHADAWAASHGKMLVLFSLEANAHMLGPGNGVWRMECPCARELIECPPAEMRCDELQWLGSGKGSRLICMHYSFIYTSNPSIYCACILIMTMYDDRDSHNYHGWF